MIAPLALVGIALSAARWRRLAPLYGMILVYFASGVLFVALSRYRVPVVPLLAVFAGAAVASIWDFALASDARRLAISAALVVGRRVRGQLARAERGPVDGALQPRQRLQGARPLRAGRSSSTTPRSRSIPAYLSSWNNLALVYERSGADRALDRRAPGSDCSRSRACRAPACTSSARERHLRELGK